ncbi:MAG: PKD domain-containing protein [bacterium]|nr:PKD domain-containing protein [bacterium]
MATLRDGHGTRRAHGQTSLPMPPGVVGLTRWSASPFATQRTGHPARQTTISSGLVKKIERRDAEGAEKRMIVEERRRCRGGMLVLGCGRGICRRGFTLAEAAVSMVVVSVMLVAALNTVGAARAGQWTTGVRARGAPLAQELMSEILQQPYEDPDSGPGTFGLGASEVGDGSRALWDDVDDYYDWSASPPEYKNGAVIDGFEEWERSVSVDWVEPDDPETAVGWDTRVKRIEVQVRHGEVDVASSVALRTWINLDPSGSRRGGGLLDGGAGGKGNQPPEAVALAAPQKGAVPLVVTLWGSDSRDPDAGDTLTYAWDFGDGGTGAGETVNHTYGEGYWIATLTVSDGQGGRDEDTVEIKATTIIIVK